MRGTLQWKNNKIVMRINVRTKGGIGSAHVLKECEGHSGKIREGKKGNSAYLRSVENILWSSFLRTPCPSCGGHAAT